NFANASFADILSEARKYKLNLTIAHQYIEQMDEIVRPAVFGNVGTMIAFRVGATDAEVLEKEFAPVFILDDLVNLGFAQIYLKLMIDGLSSQPFSATTLPPIAHPDTSYVTEIIAASREQFSRERAAVEEDVVKFHNPVIAKKGAAANPAALPDKPPLSAAIPLSTVAPAASLPASLIKVSTITAPSLAPAAPSAISPKPVNTFASTAKPTEIRPTPLVKDPVSPAKELPVSSNSTSVPEGPKPVSLESLNRKAPSRHDPKVQSSHNVSELKNALANILGKDKIEKKIENKAEKKAPLPTMTPSPLPVTVKAPLQKEAPEPVKEVPKEVPEEVLKNVLKVD
ncbi:MAG: hypothetical protein WCT02_04160, partial [Candidatus Paceibacterota bacterium]